MSADPVKEPDAYRQELLDLLGERDPPDVLAHTPARIEPRLKGIDEAVLAKRPLSMLLEELRRLRGLNMDLYLRTRGPAWKRFGLHAERGEESVELNVRLLAGHDFRHMDQIDRIVAAVQA